MMVWKIKVFDANIGSTISCPNGSSGRFQSHFSDFGKFAFGQNHKIRLSGVRTIFFHRW